MKYHICFLPLLLISFLAFAQKKVIIIGNNSTVNNCPGKAIVLTADSAKIDTCYAENKNDFAGIKSEPLSTDRYFVYLFNITMNEWEAIQNTLDKINNCDYTLPIKIEFTENNTKRTFSLKTFGNCYPDPVRLMMESLETYFKNLH